jgi:EAL domain-containing protein (putative c-di-GMP-specific phosphodiesterase class I)
VQAVVNLASARRMTTTAEGVETEEQQRLLRALGCSEMQGYLFSAAKSADKVLELFASHRSRLAERGGHQGLRREAS